jgi:hypothetical protein
VLALAPALPTKALALAPALPTKPVSSKWKFMPSTALTIAMIPQLLASYNAILASRGPGAEAGPADAASTEGGIEVREPTPYTSYPTPETLNTSPSNLNP